MIKKAFVIALECKQPLLAKDIDHSEYEFDDEYNSLTSVFYNLSESFYERGIVLHLKICDHECYNDGVELSILLEDFHNFTKFANNDENEYKMHFYEQGADRLLTFKKIGDGEYTLMFEDHDIRGFEPLSTVGSVLDLNLMLFTLFCKVRFLANKMCPSIAKHDRYINWCSGIRGIFIN